MKLAEAIGTKAPKTICAIDASTNSLAFAIFDTQQKTLGAVGWPVWNLKENNEVALLIQHPFWGFDHVLFLHLENDIWLGDFYSFVPNHNLLNMFKNYDSNKIGPHKFKIE